MAELTFKTDLVTFIDGNFPIKMLAVKITTPNEESENEQFLVLPLVAAKDIAQKIIDHCEKTGNIESGVLQ